MVKGFTNAYGLHKLLYYEVYESIADALEREHQLKNWQRKWKLDLIKKKNPEFKDLYIEIVK